MEDDVKAFENDKRTFDSYLGDFSSSNSKAVSLQDEIAQLNSQLEKEEDMMDLFEK